MVYVVWLIDERDVLEYLGEGISYMAGITSPYSMRLALRGEFEFFATRSCEEIKNRCFIEVVGIADHFQLSRVCLQIVTLFVAVFVTTHRGRLAIVSLVEQVKCIYY